MLFQNSRRVQGDVRWKHWLISTISGLSVWQCVILLEFLLTVCTCVFACVCGTCSHLCVCACAVHVISPNNWYETPLLPTEFADASWKNKALLLHRNVRAQHVCVTPRNGGGKLNNISIHRCCQVDNPFRSNSSESLTWHILCMGLHMMSMFSHEQCRSVCVSECLCWCVCVCECASAWQHFLFCFSIIHHSLSNKCFC